MQQVQKQQQTKQPKQRVRNQTQTKKKWKHRLKPGESRPPKPQSGQEKDAVTAVAPKRIKFAPSMKNTIRPESKSLKKANNELKREHWNIPIPDPQEATNVRSSPKRRTSSIAKVEARKAKAGRKVNRSTQGSTGQPPEG